MIDLGSRIKTLRIEHRLTQQQLANLLGVTKAVVSAYELGSRSPSYDVLIRIAQVFGVSTDFLFGLSKGKTIDISDLSDKNAALVTDLVQALSEKNREKKDI